MDARARVLRIQDGRATLACEESPGCGGCSSVRGCGLRWLGGNARRQLEVPAGPVRGAPLESGESVTLSMADGDLLRVAARLYLPPLAGLVAAPLLVRYAAQGGEGIVAAGAVCGLLAGWLVARAWVRAAPPAVLVSRADADEPAA